MEVNFLDREKEIKEYITKELDLYIDHEIYDEDKDYYIEEDAIYISVDYEEITIKNNLSILIETEMCSTLMEKMLKYLQFVESLYRKEEKREIKEPDYLHRHMRAIRIIDEFTYIFFEIDGTLYCDCFLQRKKVEHKKYSNLNEFREFNISHSYPFEEITIKKTSTGLEFVKEGW